MSNSITQSYTTFTQLIIRLIRVITPALCCLVALPFATASPVTSCESTPYHFQVQADTPKGMKTLPLPKRWNKEDSSYLQIVLLPKTGTEKNLQTKLEPLVVQLGFQGSKNKKTTSSITLTSKQNDGTYIISDFLSALGPKSNWPGTLILSLTQNKNGKPTIICRQELQVYVAD